MIEPIKPSEISTVIPEEVIEVVNSLISLNYRDGVAKVYQDDIMETLPEKLKLSRQEIFNLHYLDIEDLYSKYWSVEYFKANYFEDWEPYFIFKDNLC